MMRYRWAEPGVQTHTLESMNKKKQGGKKPPTKIIKTEERLEKYVATAGVGCVVGKDEVGWKGRKKRPNNW